MLTGLTGWEPAHTITRLFFGFLIIAFLINMVLSWFPISPANPFRRFFSTIIAPILDPLDRRIPPIGIFRVSFLIAFWALFFASSLFQVALPAGW
jgi:YggT family protein